MQYDSIQANVLIKEPVNKEIDSARLERIADSLFNNKPQSNIEYARWYRVRFFYMKKWKQSPYYAEKLWSLDSKHGYAELVPNKFNITNETVNTIQNSSYLEKY